MSTKTPVTPSAAAAAERMFPRLTPAQIARVAAHGCTRPISAGEVLSEAGDPSRTVPAGARPARSRSVRRTADGEELVALHRPGQFTGEVNMLSGRPALVRARASEPGEVIELDREHLLALVQTDSRDQRDHHAGLHPAPGGVDRARARRCRAGRVESLLRNAPRQRVPDAQRPSVLVHRSRP